MPFVWYGAEAREVRQAVEAIALRIRGEYVGADLHAERSTRYASVGHALAELVVYTLDGVPLAAQSDPEQLARRVHLPSDTRSAAAPVAYRLAEDLAQVQAALGQAFDPPPVPMPMALRMAQLATVARYAGKRTPTDVRDWLADAGCHVTTREVGRITRHGRRRIGVHLWRRGLVALDDSEVAKLVAGLDLEGWGAIAGHLGCSPATAKRWHARHGLPVRVTVTGSYKSQRRVSASRVEVDDWRARTSD